MVKQSEKPGQIKSVLVLLFTPELKMSIFFQPDSLGVTQTERIQRMSHSIFKGCDYARKNQLKFDSFDKMMTKSQSKN